MIFIKKGNVVRKVSPDAFMSVWEHRGYKRHDTGIKSSEESGHLTKESETDNLNESEIRERARELGINNAHNRRIERLIELIAEAESVQSIGIRPEDDGHQT